jgi:hypothetical protein
MTQNYGAAFSDALTWVKKWNRSRGIGEIVATQKMMDDSGL